MSEVNQNPEFILPELAELAALRERRDSLRSRFEGTAFATQAIEEAYNKSLQSLDAELATKAADTERQNNVAEAAETALLGLSQINDLREFVSPEDIEQTESELKNQIDQAKDYFTEYGASTERANKLFSKIGDSAFGGIVELESKPAVLKAPAADASQRQTIKRGKSKTTTRARTGRTIVPRTGRPETSRPQKELDITLDEENYAYQLGKNGETISLKPPYSRAKDYSRERLNALKFLGTVGRDGFVPMDIKSAASIEDKKYTDADWKTILGPIYGLTYRRQSIVLSNNVAGRGKRWFIAPDINLTVKKAEPKPITPPVRAKMPEVAQAVDTVIQEHEQSSLMLTKEELEFSETLLSKPMHAADLAILINKLHQFDDDALRDVVGIEPITDNVYKGVDMYSPDIRGIVTKRDPSLKESEIAQETLTWREAAINRLIDLFNDEEAFTKFVDGLQEGTPVEAFAGTIMFIMHNADAKKGFLDLVTATKKPIYGQKHKIIGYEYVSRDGYKLWPLDDPGKRANGIEPEHTKLKPAEDTAKEPDLIEQILKTAEEELAVTAKEPTSRIPRVKARAIPKIPKKSSAPQNIPETAKKTKNGEAKQERLALLSQVAELVVSTYVEHNLDIDQEYQVSKLTALFQGLGDGRGARGVYHARRAKIIPLMDRKLPTGEYPISASGLVKALSMNKDKALKNMFLKKKELKLVDEVIQKAIQERLKALGKAALQD